MAETPDLTWIDCPLCPEQFKAPAGDASAFKGARGRFVEHMAKQHDYELRQGYGWVPVMAKCPHCPRRVSRAGLKAHVKAAHPGVK